MAKTPGYVRRYTRVLQALQTLAFYPDGLPLAELAGELGVAPEALRDEILAYYTAEPATAVSYSMPGVGWISPTGEEEDPHVAEVLVLTDHRALEELGVVRMSTPEMAAVWRAGRVLADYEPDNEVLEQALQVLAEGWLSGPQTADEPGAEAVAAIRSAIEARQQLSFRYAREWRPGITERTVDPYRLLYTARGWELDAGPLDAAGDPRSFLLGNITELRTLPETFEVPDGIVETLDRNRARLSVEISLPQRAAWSVDIQADRVEVIRSDAETVTVLVELSQPYDKRLANILAPAMGEGMLMTHRELAPQVVAVAHRLLAHHGFPLP